jgi:signal transduction histidine kinase
VTRELLDRAEIAHRIEELRTEYERALRSYVAHGAEVQLRRAYELGRSALGDSISLLDVVTMHQTAVERILDRHRTPDRRLLAAASQFLNEALSPFEMAHLGFLDTNAALSGLNETLEGEARRIARMLHDGAGQLVFALELAFSELARNLPPEAAERAQEILALTGQLDQQLRCLSHELHPVLLDDVGLVGALDALARRIAVTSGLSITFTASIPERLPHAIESCLYRAVQEALINVVRHARARTVGIELDRVGSRVLCFVHDDGRGLPRTPQGGSKDQGLGLIGIRGRVKVLGGTLDVTTTPGSGTALALSIPLPLQAHGDVH